MKKETNTRLIGLFVVGAVSLIVVVFLVFGSGEYFKQTYEYIIYFRGSAEGLTEGAPVKIRGVTIGSVTRITPVFDEKETFQVEVLINTYAEVVKNISHYRVYDDELKHINSLVEKGLRAQLQLQSLLTGQLYVKIDYFPETEAILTGYSKEYIELPSIPTISEEIESKVKKSIDSFSEIEFDKISASLISTLNSLDTLIKSLNLSTTVNELNLSLKKSRELMDDITFNLDSVAQNFGTVTSSLDRTLKDADELIKSVDELTNEQRFELINALREFNEASRSFRILSDYLQRHPEALIFGKD